MSNTEQPALSFKDFGYLRFVNEAQMTKAKLKTRSFYIYHKCQYQCLKDIYSKESDECFNRCQTTLDQYYEFKKSKKPEHKIFHSVPSDQRQMEEINWTQEQVIEAKNKILDFKNKTDSFIQQLKGKLDEMDKQYKK